MLGREYRFDLGVLGRLIASVANALVAVWRWLTGVIEVLPENPTRFVTSRPEPVEGPTVPFARREWFDGSDTVKHEPVTEVLYVRAVGRAVVRPKPTVDLRRKVSMRKRLDALGLPMGRMATGGAGLGTALFEEALENLRRRKGASFAAALA